MKVLYIVTAYDRRAGDGITPWLVETIRRLGERGVTAEVLAPSYRGLGGGVLEGVRVHRYRYAPAALEDLTHDQTAPDRVRERPAYLALVPGYVAAGAAAAARLARRGGFDLVHAHWPLPHAIHGQAARRAAGIPLVLSFHGVELTFARRAGLPLLVPFLRRAIRTADAVTANSTYTARLVRDVYDRPVEVIPFGSTVAPPSPSGPGAGKAVVRGGARSELLFVGRLVERKGVRHLLDAMPRLASRRAAHLTIVGDGPLRPELERQTAALAIEDHVTFTGFVDRPELARLYAGSDVFVLPAVQDSKGDVEGLGVVLVEALSHGLPVVASNAGGITDIVRHDDTGLLVPPGDPDQLAAALDRLLGDPDLARALADRGRRRAAEAFSWDSVMARLLSVYRSLVQVRSD